MQASVPEISTSGRSTSGRSTPERSTEALDPAECRALAWTAEVGRLAFAGESGPTVRPVNFTIVESDVVLRVAPHGSVRAACGQEVAFEVDDLDPLTRSGWSVLAEGELEETHHGPDPEPWPTPDPDAVAVRVRVRRWSGRRLPRDRG